MTAGRDAPGTDPADARAALDGVPAGAVEVLAGEPSHFVTSALAGDPAPLHGPPSDH
ncbi:MULTISPECIES: hypothetical protein [unclassified Streptomyces]|uniref:hypothetical protein n=1 Tax=unclassified Streptomyces TaxID=2593676 RepID=UPI0013DF7272|nr:MULTISPECIES: hypothetical protein [unclassified Streptomyces]